MITLQHVYHEIHDEVRKNDKVHNSKTGSTLKCHSALEFSFLLLTHSYFSTAQSMYIALFQKYIACGRRYFPPLEVSRVPPKPNQIYSVFSCDSLELIDLENIDKIQPSLVIRVRPHDFYKLLLLMRVYKLQMIAN